MTDRAPTILAVTLALMFASVPAAAIDDISAGYIERLPRLDYVWASETPEVEGWPEPGQQVTWVAHVRNLADRSYQNVRYRWSIDGNEVDSGSVDLPASSKTTVELPWSWEKQRHEVVFEIDSNNAILEAEERNNEVLIHTDALSVGFYVEQSIWDAFLARLPTLGLGITTFEDWVGRRVRQFNEMAGLAVWPDTPEGVLDRWRVDEVVIVPDGALPLALSGEEGDGVPPTAGHLYPNVRDRSVDLIWGFRASTPWVVPDSARSAMFESLIHELGHARDMVDVYAWSISELTGDTVSLDPPPGKASGDFHSVSQGGLMIQQYGFIDPYSAMAMNRIAGRRATHGNYNAPQNHAEYLNELPERNLVKVELKDGEVLANHTFELYQATPVSGTGIYQKSYDDEPDLTFTTDDRGWAELPRNPFSGDAPIIHTVRQGSNVVAIVRGEHEGEVVWGYLESLAFNMEYWRGHEEAGNYELAMNQRNCSRGRNPWLEHPLPEQLIDNPEVRFEWERTGAVGHRIWVSVDGARPYVLTDVPDGATDIRLTVPRGRVGWWLEATYECGTIRSDAWFFDHTNGPEPPVTEISVPRKRATSRHR